jgi:hypothetical protein
LSFIVLQVDADDAAVEDAEALAGLEVGGAPVAEVGTGPEVVVAAFDDAEDVEGIPDLVFRVAHGAAVFMEGPPTGGGAIPGRKVVPVCACCAGVLEWWRGPGLPDGNRPRGHHE